MLFTQDLDSHTKDLINKLLEKDPELRLGAGNDNKLNLQALKNHPFFNGIDWEHLYKLSPPIDDYHARQHNYHSFSPERKTEVSYTPKICRKKTFKEHTNHIINLVPIKDSSLTMEGINL